MTDFVISSPQQEFVDGWNYKNSIIGSTENVDTVYFTFHKPFHCLTSMGMCIPKLLNLAPICSGFLLYMQIKSALKIENYSNKYCCLVPQACRLIWLVGDVTVF